VTASQLYLYLLAASRSFYRNPWRLRHPTATPIQFAEKLVLRTAVAPAAKTVAEDKPVIAAANRDTNRQNKVDFPSNL